MKKKMISEKSGSSRFNEAFVPAAKLISLILVGSLIWQNIAWACPNGLYSLRAVAFGEREDEEYKLVKDLSALAKQHGVIALTSALMAAGFLLSVPSEEFRFGPIWVYVAIGVILFVLAEYHYVRWEILTQRARGLLATTHKPTIQVQDIGIAGVRGIERPEALRPLLSAI